MAKIFLNPGHDELSLKGTPDYDCGACNESMGLYENEVAWNVGNLVAQYLEAAGCECKVLQSESLRNIYDTANEWEADYFISIHCNAFNESATGVETLVYPSDISGYKLAGAIQNQILDTFEELTDRGIKDRIDLAVLNGTDMPSVLIEMAFIDNASDAILLRDRQDDFARAIARGVTDYLSGC